MNTHRTLTSVALSSLTTVLPLAVVVPFALLACGGAESSAPATSAGETGVGASTAGTEATAGTGGTPTAGGTAGANPIAGAGGTPDSGTGGNAPVAGAGGVGPDSGGEPANVAGGSGPVTEGGAGGGAVPGECMILPTHELSEAISSVGIVTFTTDLAAVEEGRIEFWLDGDDDNKLVAPVNLDAANYRTLLLGMKGDRYDYHYRVVLTGGGITCTSEEETITTGDIPQGLPFITATAPQRGEPAKGFILTSGGLGGGFGPSQGGGAPIYIFDTDGDLVWWGSGAPQAGRAHMDWDGEWVYSMTLNFPEAQGKMERLSIDGTVKEDLNNITRGHHDFTVAPGGVVTVLTWTDTCCAVVERAADGTLSTVVPDVSAIYAPAGGGFGGNDCHTNAISYQAGDDTYVLSDRNPNLYVRISRQGELLWQLGGNNPKGEHIEATWQVNHGHHLTQSGLMLIFNNGNMGASPALGFMLDQENYTAQEVFRYTSNQNSGTLGDVQRLPNGNTLITYSNQGIMHEVDANQELIRTFSTDTASFGYAEYRETLYGPPLKARM